MLAVSPCCAGGCWLPAVFLSVFKWEPRKGWDVLLDAYVHEFSGDEPVELHIVTKPFGTGEQVGRGRTCWQQAVFFTSQSRAVVEVAKACHMHLTPARKQWLSMDRLERADCCCQCV
jgi:hypothetical protein